MRPTQLWTVQTVLPYTLVPGAKPIAHILVSGYDGIADLVVPVRLVKRILRARKMPSSIDFLYLLILISDSSML